MTTEPTVSVITPVHNAAGWLDRSIGSVVAQTFTDWELLAVDDGSTDASYKVLCGWAARDPRIQHLKLETNRGAGAARNAALHTARGQWIAYLDSDDEYYPDYLQQIATHRDRADVLVFGYDFAYEDGIIEGRHQSWDPGQVQDRLFLDCIVTPLGVAHRRQLVERAGPFNELLFNGEDWDYWRRLARSGARFLFLPIKSGRYHVRQVSRCRTLRLTAHQRDCFEENRRQNRPIFWQPEAGTGRRWRSVRRIAFLSPHAVLDWTNGAATATLDGLKCLARVGFRCDAFCGSQFDIPGMDLTTVLKQYDAPYETRQVVIDSHQSQWIITERDGVVVHVVNRQDPRGWSVPEARALLAACEMFLARNRPEAVWTYGGGPLAMQMVELAKRRDIPVVFFLHNHAYTDPKTFQWADYCLVPSEFSRAYYLDTLGLACQRLPLAVDRERVVAQHHQPRYLTFINPEPHKGVFVFTRIAEVLAHRRPDIPLLLVEGSRQASRLGELGIELGGNITVMANTPDVRQVYAQSRVLLIPSLWNESFGLVAVEAMLNGIPVLASNRGALPETIGQAGQLLDIPARYTPESRELPTAEEVEPWVEAIERLWGDAAWYEQWSQRARCRAEEWLPERLGGVHQEFFGRLTPQPAAPLVPREAFLARE